MGIRKSQGARKQAKVFIFLAIFLSLGGEILFKGKGLSLGLQVKSMLLLCSWMVPNRECRPPGKNGGRLFPYE